MSDAAIYLCKDCEWWWSGVDWPSELYECKPGVQACEHIYFSDHMDALLDASTPYRPADAAES